jgi:hypothetical protein
VTRSGAALGASSSKEGKLQTPAARICLGCETIASEKEIEMLKCLLMAGVIAATFAVSPSMVLSAHAQDMDQGGSMMRRHVIRHEMRREMMRPMMRHEMRRRMMRGRMMRREMRDGM